MSTRLIALSALALSSVSVCAHAFQVGPSRTIVDYRSAKPVMIAVVGRFEPLRTTASLSPASITQAIRLTDGRLLLVDAMGLELVSLNPLTGETTQVIDQSRARLVRPIRVGRGRSDSVFIADGRNTVVVLSPALRTARSFRLTSPDGYGPLSFVGLDRDGALMFTARRRPRANQLRTPSRPTQGSSVISNTITVFRYRANGDAPEIVMTSDYLSADAPNWRDTAKRFSKSAFAVRPVPATRGPGDFRVGMSVLFHFDPTHGDVSIVDFARQTSVRVNIPKAEHEAGDSARVGTALASVLDLHDRLWIQQPKTESGSVSSGDWWILSPAGALLGRARIATSVRVLAVDGNFILGVDRNPRASPALVRAPIVYR